MEPINRELGGTTVVHKCILVLQAKKKFMRETVMKRIPFFVDFSVLYVVYRWWSITLALALVTLLQEDLGGLLNG